MCARAWKTSWQGGCMTPTKPSRSCSNAASPSQRLPPDKPSSVTERLYRFELTASFLEQLDAVEEFLAGADARFAYDDLLAELRGSAFSHLRRFPRAGKTGP